MTTSICTSRTSTVLAQVKSLEDLDEAVHIIERSMGDCSACRKKNSNAVIFCSSGLNKSVVVAIAFLMRYRAYSLAEAFEKVWGYLYFIHDFFIDVDCLMNLKCQLQFY